MRSIKSYQFIRYLNSGTYGGVWECKNVLNGEMVACKTVPVEMCEDPNFFSHFKNELIIHSRINHPGITQMKDVIMDSDQIYIIIELCDSGDLNDIVQKEAGLSESQARKYFRQIIGAISYIHAIGVAHRDIKLENILITSGDNAKLSDFGLCKQQSNGNLLLTTCGTLVYAAPEIVKEEPYDGLKSDIWSAGVVLYSMVTNHFPWEVEEDLPPERLIQETVSQIVMGDINYPETISFELLNLLQNMLNIDPEERPSATEILQHPWMQIDSYQDDSTNVEVDPVLIDSVSSIISEIVEKFSH